MNKQALVITLTVGLAFSIYYPSAARSQAEGIITLDINEYFKNYMKYTDSRLKLSGCTLSYAQDDFRGDRVNCLFRSNPYDSYIETIVIKNIDFDSNSLAFLSRTCRGPFTSRLCMRTIEATPKLSAQGVELTAVRLAD